METIGLIAAMNQESGALLRLAKGWNRVRLGPYRATRLDFHHRICVLITSGMGIKRAADATRILVAEANPQSLVSFGIAGAVHPDLQIGDVVVSTRSYLLENGTPGKPRTLANLSDAAWKAGIEALKTNHANLLVGTTITTHGSQVNIEETEEIPHPVLEMETAGISQVALEKGIPLVSIRAISDGPQAPIPIDLEAAMDENDNIRIGRLLRMILRNPKIIFQSGQMMKNSRIAEDNAALALYAILNQPEPFIKT
jgi:adenosylhomocysteine nucleosidase